MVLVLNQIALLQMWWSEAIVQREKVFVHHSVKNLKLFGKKVFIKEAMVERVRFEILAPRPPRSANKGDVKSNGFPVRQTPRGYKETILRYWKPDCPLVTAWYKYIYMERSAYRKFANKTGGVSILGHKDIIRSATSRLIKSGHTWPSV